MTPCGGLPARADPECPVRRGVRGLRSEPRNAAYRAGQALRQPMRAGLGWPGAGLESFGGAYGRSAGPVCHRDLRLAGGGPAAGDFLLCGQEKVTKEKAALCAALRVPCGARPIGRLRNSPGGPPGSNGARRRPPMGLRILGGAQGTDDRSASHSGRARRNPSARIGSDGREGGQKNKDAGQD